MHVQVLGGAVVFQIMAGVLFPEQAAVSLILPLTGRVCDNQESQCWSLQVELPLPRVLYSANQIPDLRS